MVQYFPKFITPDLLTAIRVAAIPIIFVLIIVGNNFFLWVALFIYLFACLTDYWDGALARYSGISTDFGKLLDPIADKMLVSSVLVALVSMNRAEAFITAILISREFAVSGLRSIAVVKGIVIAASSGGKWKTALQMVSLGFLIVNQPFLGLDTNLTGRILLYLATAVSIWSGVKYFLAYYSTKQILDKAKPKDNAEIKSV